MLLYDLFDYEFSPTIKLLITWGIAFALFVVYCWNPANRKPKRNFNENSVMNYVEVDPYELQGDPKSIRPKVQVNRATNNNETLIKLDEYVKTLKAHQINNVDDVQ